MYIIKNEKEIQVKLSSQRQESILTALLQMDQIPYSLYGADTQTRISIPIEFKDRLQVVTLEWLKLTDDFRDFFK